jgi:hypothetical protein
MRRFFRLACVAVSCCFLATSTQAETIWGLSVSNQLFSFDSATPSALLTAPVTISQAGIVDIDFNNVNQELYGITGSGSMYKINPITGAATLAVTPLSTFDGSVTDFDFNPAADRVRIFTNGTTNKNYRMVPDASAVSAPEVPGTAGTVIVDGTFTNASAVLVGSAYTNAFNNPGSTTLYSIDNTSDSLQIHSVSPQFNTITQVGLGLGPAFGSFDNIGFDIGASGVAYLSINSGLYSVNLANGQATSLGGMGFLGQVQSIAVESVPEPSTIGLITLTGIGALWQSRRRWKTAC